MGEIEVNEYVRTKDGIIDEVIIEYKGKCNNPNCDRKHVTCKCNYYNEEVIVKHSKNLIDLIEVGDCVNGKYVQNIKSDRNGKYILVLIGIIEEQDIKTILTKEQYLANCYKVGGNNEI